MPRVPQASFLLPQNIAFASNPLVGHGFLQFQPPGAEFGYSAASVQSSTAGQPGALGLVHFGPMVGPAVGNMMTTSDAGGGGAFRLMAPVKSSDSEVYGAAGAAEFLPLVPAAVPTGHFLLQNMMPTGLAVPLMQPLCSLPAAASSALFAVSQGSVMSVGTPLAFASLPVHRRPHDHHHAPPVQPDSTVDNADMDTADEPSSDDSVDAERVTSTDEPWDYQVSDNPTSLASSSATGHSAVQRSASTSTRPEYADDVPRTGCSKVVPRSLSSVKKRCRLGRSTLKSLRRGDYGRSVQQPSSTVGHHQHQLACSVPGTVSQPSVPGTAGTTSPGTQLVDSLSSVCRGVEDMAAATAPASDSSVSTTLSLHGGDVDCDPGPGGSFPGAGGSGCGSRQCRVGSVVQTPRWKKQSLVRRSRLRLRHSKRERKPTVDEPSSPAEITCVGEC